MFSKLSDKKLKVKLLFVQHAIIKENKTWSIPLYPIVKNMNVSVEET